VRSGTERAELRSDVYRVGPEGQVDVDAVVPDSTLHVTQHYTWGGE